MRSKQANNVELLTCIVNRLIERGYIVQVVERGFSKWTVLYW